LFVFYWTRIGQRKRNYNTPQSMQTAKEYIYKQWETIKEAYQSWTLN